jgi:hypothetical protein
MNLYSYSYLLLGEESDEKLWSRWSKSAIGGHTPSKVQIGFVDRPAVS